MPGAKQALLADDPWTALGLNPGRSSARPPAAPGSTCAAWCICSFTSPRGPERHDRRPASRRWKEPPWPTCERTAGRRRQQATHSTERGRPAAAGRQRPDAYPLPAALGKVGGLAAALTVLIRSCGRSCTESSVGRPRW